MAHNLGLLAYVGLLSVAAREAMAVELVAATAATAAVREKCDSQLRDIAEAVHGVLERLAADRVWKVENASSDLTIGLAARVDPILRSDTIVRDAVRAALRVILRQSRADNGTIGTHAKYDDGEERGNSCDEPYYDIIASLATLGATLESNEGGIDPPETAPTKETSTWKEVVRALENLRRRAGVIDLHGHGAAAASETVEALLRDARRAWLYSLDNETQPPGQLCSGLSSCLDSDVALAAVPAFALHRYWTDDLVFITGQGKHSSSRREEHLLESTAVARDPAQVGSVVKKAVEGALSAAGLRYGPDDKENPGRVLLKSQDMRLWLLNYSEK